MESSDKIFDTVVNILRDDCEVENTIFRHGLRLQEDLNLDSLGLLTLATAIENYYEIYLEESPDRPPETIKDLVDLIEHRLQSKPRLE